MQLAYCIQEFCLSGFNQLWIKNIQEKKFQKKKFFEFAAQWQLLSLYLQLFV